MRFVLARRARGQIEFGIIYGVIALLALFAGRFIPVLSFAPSCAFKALTDLPCPTCGATRAIVHLSQGELFSALAMNPLIFAGFLAAVLALFYSLFTLVFDLPRISIALSEYERNRVRIAAVLVLLLNWIYLFFAL